MRKPNAALISIQKPIQKPIQKRRFIEFLALLIVASNVMGILPASAAGPADPVLQATIDEMGRTMRELHSKDGTKPYYLSFTVTEGEEVLIVGSLGAISKCTHKQRARALSTDLRIGNYTLDSSVADQHNHDQLPTNALPVDENYSAIRRVAWLSADDAYSDAVKNLEIKKSWLKTHIIKNRLPDLSVESPSQSLEVVQRLNFDQEAQDKWAEKVRRLSAIFRDYPKIQQSMVAFCTRMRTRWFVNSEGTRIRSSVPEVYLFVGAMTEPRDGSQYWDCDTMYALKDGELPDDEELKTWIEKFAQSNCSFLEAPLAEDYSGPILFEGQAGASFFSNLLAGNLGSENFRTGDSTDTAQATSPTFKNAFGKRIMPKYISVVDDPTLNTLAGKSLAGGYKYDDDGVPAQKVSLVENGILKAFCTSRVPLKNQLQSNGHSWMGIGANSILAINSSKTSSPQELRKRLMALGEEDGLDYVLVCKRIYSPSNLSQRPSPWLVGTSFDENCSPGSLMAPHGLYKLYLKDGHEEPIKCATIKSYDARRILKDIQAVGDDAQPYLVERYDLHRPLHIIAPSVLLREIEIERDETNNITDDVVASPLKKSLTH